MSSSSRGTDSWHHEVSRPYIAAGASLGLNQLLGVSPVASGKSIRGFSLKLI